MIQLMVDVIAAGLRERFDLSPQAPSWTAPGMISYRATLVHSKIPPEQIRHFSRLADAILWLIHELDAGHGYSVCGEVHSGDNILWRRGKRSAGDPAEIADGAARYPLGGAASERDAQRV